MAVKEKKKQKVAVKAKAIQSESRHDLMMKAKERGIKNFRVLNKEELGLVLADEATPDKIEKIVSTAVTRWKSGWGSKKAKSQ